MSREEVLRSMQLRKPRLVGCMTLLIAVGLLPSHTASGQDLINSCGEYVLKRENLTVGLSREQSYPIDITRIYDRQGDLVKILAYRKLAAKWCKDFTADGVPELMFEAADLQDPHCCWIYALYSMGKVIENQLIFHSGEQRIPRENVRNLDHGPALEIFAEQDLYGTFMDDLSDYLDPLMEWPALPMILCYRGKRYEECTHKFRGLLQEEIAKVEAELKERRSPDNFYPPFSASGGDRQKALLKHSALRFYGLHILAAEEAAVWEKLRQLVSDDVLSWLVKNKDQIQKAVKSRRSLVQ